MIDGWVAIAKLPSDTCHKTLLMISQHWFRKMFGVFRQQAITGANVEPVLWRHMASLSTLWIKRKVFHVNIQARVRSRRKTVYTVSKWQILSQLWRIMVCLECLVIGDDGSFIPARGMYDKS